MEFIWKGSKSYGRRSQLFTSLLYEHYTPPFDLCPTRACNEALPIEPLSRKYIREVCSMTKSYKTNHLLLPMGDDFAYKKAHVWYKAIDELIDLINEVRWVIFTLGVDRGIPDDDAMKTLRLNA